jgi:tRNA-specific 2-thiouridylase
MLPRSTAGPVAVALSGGVDSAVAALLLVRAGETVVGLHARVWDAADEAGGGECSGDADAAAAARVARALSVPLHTVDAVRPYWTDVWEPFVAGYAAGGTPNPDLGCNVSVKFGALAAAAAALGARRLATGHYARLAPGPTPGTARLFRGVDRLKDQSYFLAAVPGAALARAAFPVGGLTKPAVRALAAAHPALAALPAARSSAGICFVGRRDFGGFMKGYAAPVEGVFECVDSGRALAACPDLLALTLGQRARIGGSPVPLYVVGKDVEGRRVLVGAGRHHAALFARGAALGAPAWVAGAPPPGLGGDPATSPPILLQCQPRHRAPAVDGWVGGPPPAASGLVSLSRGGAPPPALGLTLPCPLRALTPGQAMVLYRGEECLGAAAVAAPGATLFELGEAVPSAAAAAADAEVEDGWGGGG